MRIKMQENIARIYRCENCGSKHRYTVRAKNVNARLSDEDIYLIISRQNKQEYKYCEYCECITLKTIVAFERVK